MKIVTSLFDLGLYEANPHRKDLAHYLENAKKLLERIPREHHVVLYVDHKTSNHPGIIPLLDLRPIELRVFAFEHSKPYSELEAIRDNRTKRPFRVRNEAKDTPLYCVFQRVKVELLARVAFGHARRDDIFAWIDLGIGSAVPLEGLRARLRIDEEAARQNGSRICLVTYGTPELVTDFQTIRQVVAGGYVHGNEVAIELFTDRVTQHYKGLHLLGISPHDETVFENVAATWPDHVDARRVEHAGHIFAI